MQGKTIYIWNIDAIANGNIDQIVRMLYDAHFEGAILHRQNLANWKTDQRKNLVNALHEAGLAAYGGAAVYGSNPIAEGEQAAEICADYDLFGFVFDAEDTWDTQPKADTNAVKLLQAFKKKQPNIATGWCYWAFWKSSVGVSWAPRKKVIWAASAVNYGNADYLMPMMYWNPYKTSQDAVNYLNRSWTQYREITSKPIVPIGRAYNGDGAQATPEAILAFDKRARELGAPGISWWSMEHALKIHGIMDALAETPSFKVITNIPSQPLTIEERIERLEKAVFGKDANNGL